MEEERKETERKKRTLEEGMVDGKVGKKGRERRGRLEGGRLDGVAEKKRER